MVKAGDHTWLFNLDRDIGKKEQPRRRGAGSRQATGTGSPRVAEPDEETRLAQFSATASARTTITARGAGAATAIANSAFTNPVADSAADATTP